MINFLYLCKSFSYVFLYNFMEIFIQILIVVFSGSAIWFVNQDKSWSKWGNVLGLIGQPLWLITTIQNEQWGMLTLTIFYIYCWAQGVYNKFLKGKIKWRSYAIVKEQVEVPIKNL